MAENWWATTADLPLSDGRRVASHFNLGIALFEKRRFKEAANCFRDVIKERSSVFGSVAPETLSAYNNLSACLCKLGDLKGAELMYRELLNEKTKNLGEDHESTLTTMDGLAGVLADSKSFGDAERLYQHVIKMRKAHLDLGDDHIDTLGVQNNLAARYLDQGKFKIAKKLLQLILPQLSQTLRPSHPRVLKTKELLSCANIGHDGERRKLSAKSVDATATIPESINSHPANSSVAAVPLVGIFAPPVRSTVVLLTSQTH